MQGGWRLKAWLTGAVDHLGYDRRNWLRIKQIESFSTFLRLNGPGADILEISPGWNGFWSTFEARTYRSVDYPGFDICSDVLDERFDIVIADQVLEHVPDPVAAVRHMRTMLRTGGHLLVATPFLFRVHARPHDYSRWTKDGLSKLLEAGGFAPSAVRTHAWGNKACARAHIGGRVRDYGFWRPMSNDAEYPMMVWAFATAS